MIEEFESENLKGRDHLENLVVVVGKIILNKIDYNISMGFRCIYNPNVNILSVKNQFYTLELRV
jgi:methylmalonyl-CoA mutase cobalamin-binding subunit